MHVVLLVFITCLPLSLQRLRWAFIKFVIMMCLTLCVLDIVTDIILPV